MDYVIIIRADHAKKLSRLLFALDQVTGASDMEIPGVRLHPLKGEPTGFWSVAVNGN